eukprot:RCo046183
MGLFRRSSAMRCILAARLRGELRSGSVRQISDQGRRVLGMCDDIDSARGANRQTGSPLGPAGCDLGHLGNPEAEGRLRQYIDDISMKLFGGEEHPALPAGAPREPRSLPAPTQSTSKSDDPQPSSEAEEVRFQMILLQAEQEQAKRRAAQQQRPT